MINKELLKGNMTTLVLVCLKNRDMYGYDLIKELQDRSGGVLEVKEGTLYPLLHSLEKDKAIESYWEEKIGERRRKYYRIGKLGKKLLKDRAAEWLTFRKLMDHALAGVKYMEGLV
jgi:PadR family transcriptional regulator, regulatory protein PadR